MKPQTYGTDKRRSDRSSRLAAAILLLGLFLLTLGYWGPWVWANAAGLRILGLDLAEYVKFVAEVRSGQIRLQREVFYLPLLALSLSLSLLAQRPEFRLPAGLRWLLNLLAIPAALALLPPAWTPGLLRTPEFVKQTAAIGLCVALALLAWPLLRRLPAPAATILVALLAAAAIVLPIAAFQQLRPALDAIYGRPITTGRGPALTALGLTLIALAPLTAIYRSREKQRH